MWEISSVLSPAGSDRAGTDGYTKLHIFLSLLLESLLVVVVLLLFLGAVTSQLVSRIVAKVFWSI